MGISAEGFMLMSQNWNYSSAKARRELGYRTRRLDVTLRETVAWYRELMEDGVLGAGSASAMSLAAAGLRVADGVGLLYPVALLERYTRRRLMARP